MTATLSAASRADFLEQAAERPDVRHLDDVATEFGMMLDEAKELVQRHGWPRPESLRKAADLLRRGGTPSAGLAAVPVAPARPLPVQTSPARDNLVESYEQLLTTARGHDVKRIAAMAAKVTEQLHTLRDLIDADRHNARGRAEVARLKQELADAQARLKSAQPETTKPRTYKTATASATGADAKTIRAWAAEQGIVVPAVGRVPATVVWAYQQGHSS